MIGYGSAGALIFSLYIIYDTQLMMGGKHKVQIYNLHISLLSQIIFISVYLLVIALTTCYHLALYFCCRSFLGYMFILSTVTREGGKIKILKIWKKIGLRKGQNEKGKWGRKGGGGMEKGRKKEEIMRRK